MSMKADLWFEAQNIEDRNDGAPDLCPCCGSPAQCECSIHQQAVREDVLTDDQGTVWRDVSIDWCETHRCEVE